MGLIDKSPGLTEFVRRLRSGLRPAPVGANEPAEAVAEAPAELEPLPEDRAVDIDVESQGLIVIDGKFRVATTLFWQLAGESSPREQAARVSTAVKTYDLYAVAGRQIALAASEEGASARSKVGATLFSRAIMGSSWIAAFPLEPGGRTWWLVGQRDGLVYEDRIYRDEGEVRSAFMETRDAPGWDRVLCPASWKVAGASDRGLGAVLQFKKRGGVTLAPVSRLAALSRRLLLPVLALTVVGGGLYGWSWYQAEEERQRLEQLRLAQQAERRFVLRPNMLPWNGAAPIEAFVARCTAEMERLILFAPGWEMGQLTCSAQGRAGTVSAGWSRSGGRISYLRAGGLPAPVDLDLSGDQASASLSFELPGVAAAIPVSSWPATQVESWLRERFQVLGLEVTLRPRIQRLTPVQRRSLESPVFNAHEVTIQTSVAIEEFAQLLSDIPALVPERLAYDVSRTLWELTVSVYHPPILPLAQ